LVHKSFKSLPVTIVGFTTNIEILGIIDEVDVLTRYVFVMIKTTDKDKDILVNVAIPKENLNTRRNFTSFIGRGFAGRGRLSRHDGELIVLIYDYRVMSRDETDKLLSGELIVVNGGV